MSQNLPKMPQNVQRWPEMAETMRGGAWRTAHAGYLLFPLIPDQTPELSFGPIRHEAGPDLRLPTRWNPRQICPVWLSWLPGNRRSIEIKVQSSWGGSSTLGMLNHLLTMEKGVGGGGGRIRHSLPWLDVLKCWISTVHEIFSELDTYLVGYCPLLFSNNFFFFQVMI